MDNIFDQLFENADSGDALDIYLNANMQLDKGLISYFLYTTKVS